jgi:hypothetical protein
MVHISRFSEELILWMSQNFGFVKIADRFTTGSSIMPQKKNPDVPELARGKTGRVVGHLMGLITLMKGQPLAYNKDNQEDKEPLFDTVDTLKDTLRIFCEMVGGQVNPATGQKEGGITVNAIAMEAAANKGYATATDLADYLVKKGLPFRDAHETVAHAVKAATVAQLRPVRAAAGGAAGLHPVDRKGRVRVPEPARQPERPQHAGRHRAGAGAGPDRPPPRPPGLKGAAGSPRSRLARKGRFHLHHTRSPRVMVWNGGFLCPFSRSFAGSPNPHRSRGLLRCGMKRKLPLPHLRPRAPHRRPHRSCPFRLSPCPTNSPASGG